MIAIAQLSREIRAILLAFLLLFQLSIMHTVVNLNDKIHICLKLSWAILLLRYHDSIFDGGFKMFIEFVNLRALILHEASL